MEDELRHDVGDRDVAAMRRVLLRFAERNGGLDDLNAGRGRPVW
jgi:hypothetical protein